MKNSKPYEKIDFDEAIELGLTQEELGASIDAELSRQAVSKWERGDNLPEVEKLLILAVKLDISMDELFADELAYLRKDRPADDDFIKRYPGLIAGLNAFADALKKLNL